VIFCHATYNVVFVDMIMNRTKSIALFAGIFAIAMTTYGLSGVSASPMFTASIPQSQEGVSMLGHVEYTVFDADQAIKSYLQTDNLVVGDGTDCAGELIFGTTDSSTCLVGSTFQFIAVGNETQGVAIGDTDLEGGGGVACGLGNDGEQARKLVVPEQTDETGSGTEVTLDVKTDTFKFVAANATKITQSGIFNNDSAKSTVTGMCTTIGTGEMFAIQDLSGSGVTVSAGDSLAVKWTITIT